MSPSPSLVEAFQPDSFGDSRKRKPADLIPFVSPVPSLVFCPFFTFLLLLLLPPLIPKFLAQ